MAAADIDPATYTVPEFAAIMGISESAAYRYCKARNGRPPLVPSFRLGRTVKISRAWVEGLLEGRYELGGQPVGSVTS